MDTRGQAERLLDASPVAAGREAVPYFLLSHAYGEDEIFLRRFFNDVSAAVRALLGISGDWPVGYRQMLDVVSTSWSPDERAAVATCRTFVAICTPRYFLSAGCGRSWGIFAARLAAHRAATGRESPALIAVSWLAPGLPDRLPGPDWIAEPISGEQGEDVSVLIRIQRHRAAYEVVVRRVAERIVVAAREDRLPAWEGAWSAAEDLFGRLRPALAVRPPVVRIAVIAGTRRQMEHIRANVEPYGERREDWAPYRPVAGTSAVARARSVAARHEMLTEVVPVNGLLDRLAEAQRSGSIVLVLVDPWSTRRGELLDALRRLKEADDGTAAILVAMSADDPETVEHRAQLRAALRSALGPGPGGRETALRAEPDNATTFDDDLAVALSEAEERVLAAAPGSPPRFAALRPILRGP